MGMLYILAVCLLFFGVWAIFKDDWKLSPRSVFWLLLLIIFIGTSVRLFPIYTYAYSEMGSYDIDATFFSLGHTIYADGARYNYSPIWFITTGLLGKLSCHCPWSYSFTIRSFLTLIDLLTLFFLILIAKEEKISMVKTATLFYLNPISFIITGFHCQFDNFAILMIIVGIYAYIKLGRESVLGKILLWGFATLGMYVKQIVVYEILACLNFVFKSNWKKIMAFGLSAVGFFLLFVPYWKHDHAWITQNVFHYSSLPGLYGIGTICTAYKLKKLFILGFLLFPFFVRAKDIVIQCLWGMLFFLTFTTGISPQYFVLPLALGALRPSKGFFVYSLFVTIFILGYEPTFHWWPCKDFQWNFAWIGAVYWFVTSQYVVTFKRITSL